MDLIWSWRGNRTPGAEARVLGQESVDSLLLGGVVHRDVLQSAARRLVGAIPGLDLALEAAHHDGAGLRRIGRHTASKSLVIEQLQ